MENAQRTSFFPEGSNVGFASCLLRDGSRDWWEEVGHFVGGCGHGGHDLGWFCDEVQG